MIYLLLFIELLMILVFFILFDRNIITPSLLSLIMFFFSTVIACLNKSKWKFDLSEKTVLIIIFSLLMICLGELLTRLILINKNQFVSSIEPDKPIKINKKVSLIVSVFLLFILFYYYKQTVKMAERVGFKSGSGMLLLAYAREASLDEGVSVEGVGSFANLLILVAKSIAYIFSYIFLYNSIKFNKKDFFVIIPVFLYIPLIILSAGRTPFIYLIAFWLLIGITLFMQNNRWNPVYLYKIIFIGIIAVCIFIALFLGAGSLKTKSTRLSAIDILSIYSGLSLPSLDKYINESYFLPKNQYFGQHTLYGIYAIISKFDKNIPHFDKPYEFCKFNGYGGNVYTCIRRYLQDYGYLGLFIMMFFLGFLYSYIFLSNNNKSRSLKYILYCSMISPIIEIGIEERFFLSLVNISNLKLIILLIMFYYIFVEQRTMKNNINLLIKG